MQTYDQKMYNIVKQIMLYTTVPDAYSDTYSLKNLNFDEYHKLCTPDNVTIVESPIFFFDFNEMQILSPPQDNNVSLVKTLSVNGFKFESVDFFMEKIWNEKDLFFIYVGAKYPSGEVLIRYTSVKYQTVEKFIKRAESVKRIRKTLNALNSIEKIRKYVNSSVFVDDMTYAKMDFDQLVKDLHDSFDDGELPTTDSLEKQ